MNELNMDRRPAANLAIANLIGIVNRQHNCEVEIVEAIDAVIVACGFNHHEGALSSLMMEIPWDYSDLIDFAAHHNTND